MEKTLETLQYARNVATSYFGIKKVNYRSSECIWIKLYKLCVLHRAIETLNEYGKEQ